MEKLVSTQEALYILNVSDKTMTKWRDAAGCKVTQQGRRKFFDIIPLINYVIDSGQEALIHDWRNRSKSRNLGVETVIPEQSGNTETSDKPDNSGNQQGDSQPETPDPQPMKYDLSIETRAAIETQKAVIESMEIVLDSKDELIAEKDLAIDRMAKTVTRSRVLNYVSITSLIIIITAATALVSYYAMKYKSTSENLITQQQTHSRAIADIEIKNKSDLDQVTRLAQDDNQRLTAEITQLKAENKSVYSQLIEKTEIAGELKVQLATKDIQLENASRAIAAIGQKNATEPSTQSQPDQSTIELDRKIAEQLADLKY